VLSAQPLPNPSGHARIRMLLRRKYGWADAWVGLLQDTSESIAVRLYAPPGGGRNARQVGLEASGAW
jgi:hypothetical protein